MHHKIYFNTRVNPRDALDAPGVVVVGTICVLRLPIGTIGYYGTILSYLRSVT